MTRYLLGVATGVALALLVWTAWSYEQRLTRVEAQVQAIGSFLAGVAQR